LLLLSTLPRPIVALTEALVGSDASNSSVPSILPNWPVRLVKP